MKAGNKPKLRYFSPSLFLLRIVFGIRRFSAMKPIRSVNLKCNLQQKPNNAGNRFERSLTTVLPVPKLLYAELLGTSYQINRHQSAGEPVRWDGHRRIVRLPDCQLYLSTIWRPLRNLYTVVILQSSLSAGEPLSLSLTLYCEEQLIGLLSYKIQKKKLINLLKRWFKIDFVLLLSMVSCHPTKSSDFFPLK